MTSSRIYKFQLIRALACLLVCVSHIFITQKQTTFLNENYPIAIGQIGVGMFFFISGYLIMRSLNNSSASTFALHRILRIYPTMTLVSCIIFGINHFYGLSPRCEGFGKSTALAQLFLVNDIFSKCQLLTVQWTLLVEIKFYIIAALAFYLSRNIKGFLILFYGLTLAIYLVFMWLDIHSVIAGIIFISFGILFFYKEKYLISFNSWVWLNVFAVLLATFMFYQNYELRLQPLINLGIGYLACLGLLQISFKENKIINFFADISYPLYLTHYLINFDSFDFIEKVLIFLVVVGFSWLIHIFIEKPAIRFSKNLIMLRAKVFKVVLVH